MSAHLIVVVPAKGQFEDALRAWSLKKTTALSGDDLNGLLSPKFAAFCTIDRTCRPMPVKEPAVHQHLLEHHRAETCAAFALRAMAENVGCCADLGNIPVESEGRFIFADAVLAPCVDPTGYGRGALGTGATVIANLDVRTLHRDGLDGTGIAIALMDGGISREFLERKLGREIHFNERFSWSPPVGL